jgi:beta-lactamase superfamily II metal-dependent hydrolase
MLQVMKHLAAATGNHIHVVVASHEHSDHLSGFVQKDSPFLKDALTIGQLWVAWTEKFGDPDADRLRKEKAAAREVIKRAVEEARSKHNAGLDAFAEQLDGLMDFEMPPDGPLTEKDRDAVISAIKRFVGDAADRKARLVGFATEFTGDGMGLAATAAGKKPTSNELALGLLAAKAESVEYLVPGVAASIADVRRVRAYVLGPPKEDVFLKKDLPTKVRGGHAHEYKETYLGASVELQSLRLAPALNASFRDRRAADQQHPFAYDYRRGLPGKAAKSQDPQLWGETLKRRRDTTRFFAKHYFESQHDWRGIDGDWLAPAEQLALHLDSDTNNTTLVLAFELGEPGSGDVLLFSGDAQVGNWLSWREQQYKAEGKTVTVDDLLRRTLVYKVGHHGSHNATLKNYVQPGSRDDGEPYGLELMNDIIALLPVDRDAADRPMPNPWRMPHHPLYRRLRAKSDRRVLRSDLSTKPFSESAAKDLYPESTDWTAIPGKPKLLWRRSVEEFKEGTEGPLYYDVRIPVGRRELEDDPF